ncbi:MAG: efflux RND transporter periplasmic adaptor subunit [Acetatifactor sp.]|nr:efflux RND transporter periplasmic adaptor subunit [Acetatifactor sp.]
MRMRKRSVWLKRISVLTTLVLLLCGCGQQEEPGDVVLIEQEDGGISYVFATVEVGDVVKMVTIPCKYRQVGEQEVKVTQDDRILDRLYVKKGDTVKKGQLLAEMSSQDLKRAIEDLEYRIARNELLLGYLETNESIDISRIWVETLNYGGDEKSAKERVAQLQRTYRYRREDYSDALAADREELEQRKAEYRDSRIYATMDGVVYNLDESLVGYVPKLGTTIMTVMDTSESLFMTSAPDAVQYFREGETVPMSISFGIGAGDYLLLPYRMDEWGETQLFEVFEGPESVANEVGTSGLITVVEDSRQNVLTVPLGAVRSTGDGDRCYVYVLNEDGVREVKWVETGLYGNSLVEILSGLAEGEKVILK